MSRFDEEDEMDSNDSICKDKDVQPNVTRTETGPASPTNTGGFLSGLAGKGKNMKHKRSSQSGAWRPDEDEMCLTTTVVQGKDVASGMRVDEESLESGNGHSGTGMGTDGTYGERPTGPAQAPGQGQNQGQQGNFEVVVTREFAWESKQER
jgi:hypothetical protein